MASKTSDSQHILETVSLLWIYKVVGFWPQKLISLNIEDLGGKEISLWHLWKTFKVLNTLAACGRLDLIGNLSESFWENMVSCPQLNKHTTYKRDNILLEFMFALHSRSYKRSEWMFKTYFHHNWSWEVFKKLIPLHTLNMHICTET